MVDTMWYKELCQCLLRVYQVPAPYQIPCWKGIKATSSHLHNNPTQEALFSPTLRRENIGSKRLSNDLSKIPQCWVGAGIGFTPDWDKGSFSLCSIAYTICFRTEYTKRQSDPRCHSIWCCDATAKTYKWSPLSDQDQDFPVSRPVLSIWQNKDGDS